MNFDLSVLWQNIAELFQDGGWKMVVMWIIGGVLILGFTLWNEITPRKEKTK